MKKKLAVLLIFTLVFISSANVFGGPQPYEGYENVTLTVESQGYPQQNNIPIYVEASGGYTLIKSDLSTVTGTLSTDSEWTIQFQMYVVFDGQDYTYEYPNWISSLSPTDSGWQFYDNQSYSYSSSITTTHHEHKWWGNSL